MTSKRRPYNQYSDEFKEESLRQLEACNRPATELATARYSPQYALQMARSTR